MIEVERSGKLRGAAQSAGINRPDQATASGSRDKAEVTYLEHNQLPSSPAKDSVKNKDQ